MAFRKTLGTIGTTAILAFAAVGAASPAANAAEPVVTISGQQLSIVPATAAATPADQAQGESVVGVTVTPGTNKPLSLSCGNYGFDGPWFYETCSGSSYRVFVDCSDGYRYISTSYYSGTHSFALKCPAGNAVGGGAIGN
ncbi:hypothetical protein ACWD4P_20220 [Kitasatospora sp. NPDC002543]